MLAKLDERHNKYSEAGAVGARATLNELKYDDEADFSKFLRLFEAKLNEAIDAGNTISPRDAMYQLVTALGPKYLNAVNMMRTEPEYNQRFEIFQTKVREIHDLEKIFSKQKQSNDHRTNHEKHHSQDHKKGKYHTSRNNDRDKKVIITVPDAIYVTNTVIKNPIAPSTARNLIRALTWKRIRMRIMIVKVRVRNLTGKNILMQKRIAITFRKISKHHV